MSQRRKSAFTLTEMLVVIGVIVLLVALLFPVLSQVKLRGQRAKCLNNIRQLSLASFMYVNDNGKPMPYKPAASYPGGTWMGTITELIKVQDVLICPSAPLQKPAPASGNRPGCADKSWVRWTDDNRTMFSGSYGYNAWLYADLEKYYRVDATRLYTQENAIESPSQTPAFVDANWVDLSPKETDGRWPNLYTGAPFGTSSDNQMGRCLILRHGNRSASSAPRNLEPNDKMPGAIQMGFADGHAALVPLEDLWKYYWSANWKVPQRRRIDMSSGQCLQLVISNAIPKLRRSGMVGVGANIAAGGRSSPSM